MNHLIIAVNLFFTPTLTLYFFCKCRGKAPIPSPELFFPYCAAVCCNPMLTKFLLYFSRITLGFYPPVDSVLYTLVAAVSACILVPAALIAEQLQIEIKLSRNEEHYDRSNQETKR